MTTGTGWLSCKGGCGFTTGNLSGVCAACISKAEDAVRTVKAKLEAAKADPISHPPHYTKGKIEPIDVIEDWGLSFCLGNVVKYIARAGKKDPGKLVEDLKKAAWYLAREIEQLEKAK